jgi:ACR3 family arsenite transporter
MIGVVLSWLGQRGPILLVVSLCCGLIAPALAELSREWLSLSAFLLTLGSFLTAGFAPSESIRSRLIVMTLVWVGIALPFAAAVALRTVAIDPALRTGVLLSLLAPPVGSAAAIASMIGLQPRLALLASLTLTIASPVSMPLLAYVLDLDIGFNGLALASRLLLIVGGAAVLSLAAVKWRGQIGALLPDQQAAAGVAVIGLMIVGLAAAGRVHAHWAQNPMQLAKMLGVATAVNFGLCALSALVFLGLGVRLAATIGLISGNRNVTLAWAAASAALSQLGEAYVAACVIPVLTLPLILRAVLKGRRIVEKGRWSRPDDDRGCVQRILVGVATRHAAVRGSRALAKVDPTATPPRSIPCERNT